MINMYPHYESQEFEIDDVPVLLENLHEFLAPMVKEKDTLPLSSACMRICKWQEVTNNSDTYLSILILVDLTNVDDFKLRVVDGYYSQLEKDICEGDGFVDIKTDETSIQQAFIHIKNGTIPLHNRIHKIDYEKHPYIVIDEDDDDY